MKAWQLTDGWGREHLGIAAKPEPEPPGPAEIIVEFRFATLDYRDLPNIAHEEPRAELPYIPCSDAAGDVVAIGDRVTDLRVGDRVCPLFYRDWLDGPPTMAKRAAPLGSAARPGVLQQRLKLEASAVARFPAHLSYQEAAGLPCAGLTAWNAVDGLTAGQTLVVQGTGGVSMLALQFAKLRGARVIATSSSDDKLCAVQALGADGVINYRDTPKWGKAVLDLTDGRGADRIIEVGGPATMAQSITAAAFGAAIVLVGILTGRTQELPTAMVCFKQLHITGVSVDSGSQFLAMAAAIEAGGMKPVCGPVYGFEQVPDAFAALASGDFFGKIAIDLGR